MVFKPNDKKNESNEKSLSHLELCENILFGKSKDIQAKDANPKISSSKEKSRPKIHGEQVYIGTVQTENLIRKFSASPRKNYSKHLE
jgi:hypothetical protein